MEKVSNIVHVVNLPHDILVSWDAVVGATSYTAELRSGNQTVESQSVAVPEVPFAALVIGQIYEILITATDGVETSEPARYVVYLSERDWLSPPPDLAYTELETGDGFTVTWGASPSALSYRMVVEPFGVQDPEEVFNGPATSPHVISGLPPEKLFRVYVYPVNGSEEGQPSTIVGWVQPDVGEARPTAHRLFPAEVQGSYYLLYQPYIQNMRPLHEDENYWRLVDHFDYIDGPPDLGERYTKENITWKSWIENTETEGKIWLTRLGTESPLEYLMYTHTSPVQSVSVEFDQLGRQIISFESEGEVYLYWYDPNLSADTLQHLGTGITPIACTDSYLRTGNTSGSERFVFYRDTLTKRVVGHRQSDRYSTAYEVAPNETREVLELLQVSKNLIGAFVVVAAVRDFDGSVVQVVWDYREHGVGAINIGSDGDYYDTQNSIQPYSGQLNALTLKHAINDIPLSDIGGITSFGAASITSFELVNKVIEEDFGQSAYQGMVPASGLITQIEIKDVMIQVGNAGDVAELPTDVYNSLQHSTAQLLSLELVDARIDLTISATQSCSPAAGQLLTLSLE